MRTLPLSLSLMLGCGTPDPAEPSSSVGDTAVVPSGLVDVTAEVVEGLGSVLRVSWEQPEAAPTEAPKLGGAAGEALPAELLFEDVLLDCAELLPACTREPSELPVYDFKGRLRNTSKS